MSKKNHEPLSCIIDRFEGNLAVLSFGNGQILNISRKFISQKAKEGDKLTVQLYGDAELSKNQQELARHILEEILNGG